MVAAWQPSVEAPDRAWIGLGRTQDLAWRFVQVAGGAAGAAAVAYANHHRGLDIVFGAIGVAVGIAIAAWVLVPPRSHLVGLVATSDTLQIRKALGLRTRSIPWNEITAVDVVHRAWRGGDVVVIRADREIVLPCPVSARRWARRWFADPDFEAKVAYLRSRIELVPAPAR